MKQRQYTNIDQNEFDEIMDKLKNLVYQYNENLKKTGYYLKPFHVVYKKNGKEYYYFGRYWYRLEYGNKKMQWIYLGKDKPDDKLPDPPMIPEVTIMKRDGKFYVDPYDLDRLRKFVGET